LVITLLNPYFFKPKEYEFATDLRSRFGCVEFKNSFKESVRVKSIQNKLQDGYHVLSGIFTELKLKITDYKLIFCVVHKVNKPNRERRSVANSYSFSLRRFFVLIGVLFFQSFLFNKRGFGLFLQ
jgi:hypothetical protein